MLLFELFTWMVTGLLLALVEAGPRDVRVLGRPIAAAVGGALIGGLLGRSAGLPALTLLGYSVLGLVCAAAMAQLTLLLYGRPSPRRLR